MELRGKKLVLVGGAGQRLQSDVHIVHMTLP